MANTIAKDTTNNVDDDTLSIIAAMRTQEDEVSPCYHYLQRSSVIDESCRASMVSWYQRSGKALKLSPDTIWSAISYFDRYLSSGKGKSNAALEDKYKFQLAAIASFYIAVKAREDVILSANTLSKLCKGYYQENDILELEEDILFALDFRLATPTAMEFVQHYMKLLPQEVDISCVLKDCQEKIAYTSTDFYFTFFKPSVIGASCLASTLIGKDLLTNKQRQTFYLHLANTSNLIDIIEAEKKLVAEYKEESISNTVSKASNKTSTTSISTPSTVSQTSSSTTSSIVSKVRQHQQKMAKSRASAATVSKVTSYRADSIIASPLHHPSCNSHVPRAA